MARRTGNASHMFWQLYKTLRRISGALTHLSLPPRRADCLIEDKRRPARLSGVTSIASSAPSASQVCRRARTVCYEHAISSSS